MTLTTKQFKSLPLGLKLIILWLLLVNPALILWLLIFGEEQGGLIKILFIVIGVVLSWIIAYFLLQRKNWMRKTVIVFSAIGSVINLFTLLAIGIFLNSSRAYSSFISALILTAVNIVTIWYLSRKKTKEIFRQNKEAEVVPLSLERELSKWNWGAFVLTWVWGLGNHVYIALLVFVPILGFVVQVLLGLKGSRWAWEARQWESLEKFKRAQRRWAIAGLITLVVLPFLAGTAFYFLVISG